MISHFNLCMTALAIFLTTTSAVKADVPKRSADQYIEHVVDMEGVTITGKTYVWHTQNFSQKQTDHLISKIGYVYPNNSIIRHIKSAPGKTNGFDVIYRVNDLSLRIQESAGAKEKHLIVAGDSHTFGIGIKDSETLPAVLAAQYPNYRPYNFGHGGGSANNTLSLLENFPWHSHIKEKSGKMIYLFSAAWMFDRVVGTKGFVSWDMGQSPWYYLKNDQLVYGGSFNDRFLTKIFNFINWVDRFHWIGDLPKVHMDHFRLIAKILQKMKAEYLEKFPEGEFLVAVSYFGDADFHPLADQLVAWLKDMGVGVVGIQKKPDAYNAKNILVDYHFNYEGQKAIAKELGSLIKF